MLKPIEILWFEDVNPFNEPVFGFPLIGRISMRQMAILGMGALSSWMIYQANGSFISAIPLGLAMFLALKKQKVRSSETHFFMLMLFYFANLKKSNAENTKNDAKLMQCKKKGSSSNLGLAKQFNPKLDIVRNEIAVREIFADPLKPIRLKIKLEGIEGKSITNKQTKIVCNGNVVSALSTDNNGELEAIIIPQTLGKKKIQIFAEDITQPVFEEILSVNHL